MLTLVKTAALTSTIVGFLSAPALACDLTSATDASCGSANPAYFNNPANPSSPLNMSSPNNPNSPFSMSNPANPNSPLNMSNPANPLNAANQRRDPASDPNSPYFSEPTYADGIFGLFETNPRIVYPAGQPQTCRLGLDCPADVARSSGATLYGLRPVAQAAAPLADDEPAPRHRRRHRATR